MTLSLRSANAEERLLLLVQLDLLTTCSLQITRSTLGRRKRRFLVWATSVCSPRLLSLPSVSYSLFALLAGAVLRHKCRQARLLCSAQPLSSERG